MKLRLVNENKLKIMLTDEDMAQLDITYEEMDYPEDMSTRRFLWEILDEAKRQTGFDAGKERIYVQLYREKTGGCFMYVTKEKEALKDFKDAKNSGNLKESQLSRRSDPHTYEKKYRGKLYTGVKKKRILYMFDNTENLLGACARLNAAGYCGKSDIFADSKKYYLYIEDNREPALELLSEYGVLLNNPYFGFSLDEHTEKIMSGDAVKRFSEVFR